MITGAVCVSHTPLLDRARADRSLEDGFLGAISKVSLKIAAWEPDVAVVFFPDHLNGFFYDLMPSFCVGVRATSIGDFGTIPGPLDIPEELAADCIKACIDGGIDIASSYKMQVDHGAVQPVELLSEAYPLTRLIPIFINSAAPPLPTFRRVRALGEVVGRWAAGLSQKVLIVASGGLSHDPPLPSMATATPEAQAALIDNRGMTHAGRLARQNRTYGARHAYVDGMSPLRPLNPDWDRALLDSLTSGHLEVADDWSEREVTEAGGRGGHEVRTWLAALSALKAVGGYRAEVEFYAPINEWLTGTGLLSAEKVAA